MPTTSVGIEILIGNARGTVGHVKAVPDSGAEGFFIGLQAMENIGLQFDDFSTAMTRIILADGSEINPVGDIRHNGYGHGS